jgi:hypothetical protein
MTRTRNQEVSAQTSLLAKISNGRSACNQEAEHATIYRSTTRSLQGRGLDRSSSSSVDYPCVVN